MSNKGIRKFYLSIVLPSIIAICLFIISIYIIIIPAFEKNIMERKKEMIGELTKTAWSLLEEYDKEYKNNEITLSQAKQLAASKIKQMRYGKESKDYFWIIDMHPNMIMHPYRKELNGTDLSNYQDPEGKKLFVEAVNIVNEKGEGYIHYLWQWKDDSTRIVPKLSFVKAYHEWKWVVGTGIYLEDVKEEISSLRARLLKISFIITIVISIILLYIIRQSLNIEKRRKNTEEKLKTSRQKYQTLVDASIDGTIMIINNKIIFSNLKFNKMLGSAAADVLSLSFDDIFEVKWKEAISYFSKPGKSVTIETHLKCIDKPFRDVVITVSKILYEKQDGFIIITKDTTRQKQIEKETKSLSSEVQTSLLLMNQPIKHFIKDLIKCDMNTSITDVALLMTRKKQKVIFICQENKIIGVVNDSDLKTRVLAKNLEINKPVSEIMTAPVVYIQDNILLYEAVLLCNNENISHLAVKNNMGAIIGVISNEDILEMQRNTLSYLIREIEIAEDIHQIKIINEKAPVLIKALLESGGKTLNITRIITSLTDAISKRIIALAIETVGQPPCKFAFIALGSEGRMEQTLATDQDNAIIFDDSENVEIEEAYQYFHKLAEIINKNLDYAGYEFCKGDIMAKNPKWTQPLAVWKEYFSDWIINSDPQSILDACIFFDFRCIYGNREFTNELRDFVNELVEYKAVFFHHLANSVIKFKSPVSLFGSIIGESDLDDNQAINIKKILLPIICFIRIYAIKNKLKETNSLERAEKLYSMKIFSKPLYDELVLSYNYLMLLRFRFQTIQLLNNNQPNNLIDINKLTDIEKTTLKKIFSEITNLQTKLSFDFKGMA
ncbi:MAG: cache domain-containing protein [Bacteroidales bacterium]|nr:cache domain-containing protein [Bacteroidales bacterium]